MLPFDIAGAIASGINQFIEFRRIDRWCRLVFTMGFSGIVSFLTVCGASLSAHRPTYEAIGTGMCSAAVMMTVLFRRSDLTKGMIVALPTQESKQEIETDTQVIQK